MLASPDHEAFGMGMFHRLPADDGRARSDARELPHRPRPRLRQPRPRGCGRHRAQLRAVEPAPPAVPTCCPRSTASSTQLAGRDRRRRHRLRRRRGGAADGDGVPGQHVHRLRHLAVTLSTGPSAAASRPGVDERARSTTPASEPMPDDHSVDLVTTFDCIHDMTHPQGMMDAIRAAVADDGTWLLVDIKARDTFAENVREEPDGVADVRDQRAVVHVVGAVERRTAPGSARSACRRARAEEMARGGRLHPVPPPRRRPCRQRVLRDPALTAPDLGGAALFSARRRSMSGRTPRRS